MAASSGGGHQLNRMLLRIGSAAREKGRIQAEFSPFLPGRSLKRAAIAAQEKEFLCASQVGAGRRKEPWRVLRQTVESALRDFEFPSRFDVPTQLNRKHLKLSRSPESLSL